MDRWYEADELRESWCLLVLIAAQENDQRYAKKWALGDANAQHLLETEQQTIPNPHAETDLLISLGEELDRRRYQEITLITPARHTLRFLRARLFSNDAISHPTLRGFRHITLNDIIEKYIDSSAIDSPILGCDNPLQRSKNSTAERGDEIDVERVWKMMVKLVPLVPANALEGEPT